MKQYKNSIYDIFTKEELLSDENLTDDFRILTSKHLSSFNSGQEYCQAYLNYDKQFHDLFDYNNDSVRIRYIDAMMYNREFNNALSKLEEIIR